MLVIGGPRPIVANSAFQGEDAAQQLTAIEEGWIEAIRQILGVVGGGNMGKVEIAGEELATGEGGDATGLDGGAERSGNKGIVALDHERGLRGPRGLADTSGKAIIQLHR